jgi:hypothetical protein
MLKIEYLDELHDVYDITVEDNHNFYADGILVHNCQEITLPTTPLNDIRDGSPVVKTMKMTKEEYLKYLEWKKVNPNTPIKGS